MSNPTEFTINSGNPQADQQQLAQIQQSYQAQGMQVQAQPLPTGGYQVKVFPPGGAPAAAGGYPGAPPGGGAPGGAPPGGGYGGPPGGAPPGGGYGGPPGGAPPGGGYGGPPGGAPPGGGYGGPPGGAPPGGGYGGPPGGAPPGGGYGGPPGGMGGPPGGGPPGMGGPMPNASQPKKSMIGSPQVAGIVAVVCALVATGITFVLSSFPVAVMAGVGAGVALVLGIVAVVVTKPGILNSIVLAGGALVLGGAGGGGMWFMTHPGVWVDNPTGDTITVFVDGEKIGTVKANANKSFNIAKGEHKLGYATGKAKKPEETVKADVEMGGNHLYNPGKTGCYWLQVDVYGSANTGSMKEGPLELKEFYTFDHVDNWFKDNPEVVSVDKKSSGTTKVALRYAVMCMEFKKCDLKVREKLAKCTVKAFDGKSEEAMQACGDEAAAKCGAGGGGDSSKKQTGKKK